MCVKGFGKYEENFINRITDIIQTEYHSGKAQNDIFETDTNYRSVLGLRRLFVDIACKQCHNKSDKETGAWCLGRNERGL